MEGRRRRARTPFPVYETTIVAPPRSGFLLLLTAALSSFCCSCLDWDGGMVMTVLEDLPRLPVTES